MFPTRVLRDCDRFLLRARRVQLTNVTRKLGTVLDIDCGVAFGPTLSRPRARVRVCETLAFCSLQRPFFYQEPLSLVATAGATEPNDNDSQRRIPTAAARQRGVAPRQESQVREVSALHAQRLLALQAQEIASANLVTALGAFRVAKIVEHDYLVRLRCLSRRIRWACHRRLVGRGAFESDSATRRTQPGTLTR
jgi:hypothetical protein